MFKYLLNHFVFVWCMITSYAASSFLPRRSYSLWGNPYSAASTPGLLHISSPTSTELPSAPHHPWLLISVLFMAKCSLWLALLPGSLCICIYIYTCNVRLFSYHLWLGSIFFLLHIYSEKKLYTKMTKFKNMVDV